MQLGVFPFGVVAWTAETVRVVLGMLEVLFGSLVLCPRYTRVAAVGLGQHRTTHRRGAPRLPVLWLCAPAQHSGEAATEESCGWLELEA